MKYNIISTGSKGNAVVIEDTILIDCGVSFKALQDVYKDIKLVLLTHIHSDHFKVRTLRKLAEERPTLRFGCCNWLVCHLANAGVPKRQIDVFDIGQVYDYKAFKVSPIKLYHDVPNCGYRLFYGKEKLFYATDTNSLEGISATSYDLYMIENNYEDEEILRRIQKKEDAGQFAYEKGVLHSHLSKQKCDNFIVANAGPNSRFVYLHQHEKR